MWGDDNATGGAVWPFAPTLRVKRGEVMRIGLRNNLIRAPGESAERGLRMGSVYKMQDFIALHTHGLHAGAPPCRRTCLRLCVGGPACGCVWAGLLSLTAHAWKRAGVAALPCLLTTARRTLSA